MRAEEESKTPHPNAKVCKPIKKRSLHSREEESDRPNPENKVNIMIIQVVEKFSIKLERTDGYADAAFNIPPRSTEGDYYQGYLDYTRRTGNAPF